MDPVKHNAIDMDFQEFSSDNLYWNTISGSPFFQVGQPSMRSTLFPYTTLFRSNYAVVRLKESLWGGSYVGVMGIDKRSEEHTSELQSRQYLVCRLLLEKKNNTEKSVFHVIVTVIKEQMARIGVTTNIRLTDKVSWMNVATQDGPFDMYVEDLASLMTVDQNSFMSASTASWNSTRHTDPKVDEYYARYGPEMDPVKRKAIAREFQEFSADKLYCNTISGSPFYQVAQPWMKDYVYQAEFKVLYKKVWLDK